MSKREPASPFPTARPFKVPVSVTATRVRRPAPPARSLPASMIGAQVRSLRVAAGVSGGALASTSGISRSMLSRIERGLVSASIETLHRIAKGLDVSISRFFADQMSRSDFCHVRAEKGIIVERIGAVSGYQYELLGHLLSGNLFVEPYLVRLLPEANPYMGFQHPGIKFLYFLSGRVTYRYGLKAVQVAPGDSLLFDARALHGIEAIAEGPVCYLSLVFTLRD